jgi:pectate lyase
MKKSNKILTIFCGLALSFTSTVYAQTIFTIATPDGFAKGTTGGGLTLSGAVTVSSAADLISAVSGSSSKVIIVKGILDCGTLNVGSNKTIIGADTKSGIKGKISIRSTNVILQNLTIGPSSTDCIEVSGGSKVFIHKCSIYDGADGSCDVVRQADWVTVSWCHFYYINQTTHMNTCMVGNGDDVPADRGKLHVTIHHVWWGAKVDQRMPRCRYGQIHVYNNYYGAPKSAAYCVGVGFESSILLENNYFNDQAVAWRYQNLSTGGKIQFRNNILNKTVADASIPNSTVFDPTDTYTYKLDDPNNIQSIVTNATCGAGNLPASCSVTNVEETTETITPSFKAYPNPFKNELTVDFKGIEGAKSLEILDVNGNTINTVSDERLKDGLVKLNLDLPNGIYTVKILSGNGKMHVEKIISK